jgi:GntR family phosphonate transport system transcriptional regulator
MSLYAVARGTGEALYMQIAHQLEQEISQLYIAGDCLPSEKDLALRFGVNRHTLRRAIDELVDLGLVERQHGRGIFVLDAHIDYQIAAGTRFTENITAVGLSSENEIVRKQWLPATARIAERLAIQTGDTVLWMETLRLADQRPLCVISHFVPQALFPNLDERYQSGSLHALLTDHYGCQIRRNESLITSVLPQGDDARLLNMPQHWPVLRIKSVNIDERTGRPIEYAIGRFRADQVQFRINPNSL